MNGELRLLLERIRAGEISLQDALPVVRRLEKRLRVENDPGCGELVFRPTWKETPWNRSVSDAFVGKVLLFCGNRDDYAARFRQAISGYYPTKDGIGAPPGNEKGNCGKNTYGVN